MKFVKKQPAAVLAGNEAAPISNPSNQLEPAKYLDAALKWFRLGYRVIPIVPGEKMPPFAWNPWLETLSEASIIAHWNKHPDHGVGCITDEKFIVFDADSPKATSALLTLERKHGIEPGMVVQTSRGLHHYFLREAGASIKSQGHSTQLHPERIDVRTGRSLVVMPPTQGKALLTAAVTVSELTPVSQAFLDDLAAHNGKSNRESESKPFKQRVHREPIEAAMPELKAMLKVLNPDFGYDDWLRVGMAIHYETGGSDEGLDLYDDWSSRGTKYKSRHEIESKWNSFRPPVDAPITRATLHKMLADLGIDWMEVCADAESRFEPCETEVIEPLITPQKSASLKPLALAKYSLKGASPTLAKLAADERFIFDDLVKAGDFTVIYAAPGTGKTLLTMHMICDAIRHQRVDPTRVFYVNCDDNLNGVVAKLRVAEEHGFHMLAEGHKEFRVKMFGEIVEEMIKADDVADTVIILDTYKKFANIMDKVVSSGFNSVLRRFTAKGGSVVALAHTNKKRGQDGKRIHAGTSDLMEDCDCAYMLDIVDATTGDNKHTVRFEKQKARGNNASEAFYSYQAGKVETYSDLLSSVTRTSGDDFQVTPQVAPKNAETPIINAITQRLQRGPTAKMELLNAAMAEAGCSRTAAVQVIERYTGDDPEHHRWNYRKEARNAHVYSLLTSPSPTPA